MERRRWRTKNFFRA